MSADGLTLQVTGAAGFVDVGRHRLVVQECGAGQPSAPTRTVAENAEVVVGLGSGERSEYHVIEMHVMLSRLHKCTVCVFTCVCILTVAFYVWVGLTAAGMPDIDNPDVIMAPLEEGVGGESGESVSGPRTGAEA